MDDLLAPTKTSYATEALKNAYEELEEILLALLAAGVPRCSIQLNYRPDTLTPTYDRFTSSFVTKLPDIMFI